MYFNNKGHLGGGGVYIVTLTLAKFQSFKFTTKDERPQIAYRLHLGLHYSVVRM